MQFTTVSCVVTHQSKNKQSPWGLSYFSERQGGLTASMIIIQTWVWLVWLGLALCSILPLSATLLHLGKGKISTVSFRQSYIIVINGDETNIWNACNGFGLFGDASLQREKEDQKIVCDCCVDAVTFEWVEYLRTTARSLMNSSLFFPSCESRCWKEKRQIFFLSSFSCAPFFFSPLLISSSCVEGTAGWFKIGRVGGGGLWRWHTINSPGVNLNASRERTIHHPF